MRCVWLLHRILTLGRFDGFDYQESGNIQGSSVWPDTKGHREFGQCCREKINNRSGCERGKSEFELQTCVVYYLNDGCWFSSLNPLFIFSTKNCIHTSFSQDKVGPFGNLWNAGTASVNHTQKTEMSRPNYSKGFGHYILCPSWLRRFRSKSPSMYLSS